MRYAFLLLLFFIVSCKRYEYSPTAGGYYHHHIYFGKNISLKMQKGIQEGCQTAQGIYTKSHTLFQNDIAYNRGWFLGRNRCNQRD